MAEGKKVQLHRKPRTVYIRGWYALAVILLCSLLTGAGNLWYTNRLDKQSDSDNEQNDRKWCVLLTTMDDAYSSGPTPTTEVGRRIAAAIHNLRIDLGC